jgi:hypothetical protein
MSKVQHAAESVGFHKETDTKPKGSVEPESAQHASGDHCPECFNAGYDAAAAQRDQLLAACKGMLEGYAPRYKEHPKISLATCVVRAIDAIANCQHANAEGK